MEDSANKDFSHDLVRPNAPAALPPFESQLSLASGKQSHYHTSAYSAKPPKVRKSNVAVGQHSASNFNNLALFGHKGSKKRNPS